MLLKKLAEIEQQIKMERRMRRKTQKFYKSMKETSKGNEKTGKGTYIIASKCREKSEIIQFKTYAVYIYRT